VVRLSEQGSVIAELAAGLHQRVAQDVHRLGLKNDRCPMVGKGFNLAAKLGKLELVAEQLQGGRGFVSGLRIRALDRVLKKLENRRADRGPDAVGGRGSPGASGRLRRARNSQSAAVRELRTSRLHERGRSSSVSSEQ
jgi:hypothetical protein